MKGKLREIIFEAETPAGKMFDIALLVLILFSTGLVVLESVPHIHSEYGVLLQRIEWVMTVLFTIEYLVRVYCITRPRFYIFSFYGLVDLMAVLPSYLSLFIVGNYSLTVIRALRLLRIFRILKLGRFLIEAKELRVALKASRYKIVVFLFFVAVLALLVGSLMYLVEGDRGGFTSIPKGIYWAIVTMTTVGYGDVVPVTAIGQFIASCLMIIGYAIIAVPTGIISNEIAQAFKNAQSENTKVCQSCSHEGHDSQAVYCKICGEKLGWSVT